MEANKEISLKLKELAKIRRKIKQNKIYAFRLSLEDPEEFDSNPFKDEIEFLRLQEILIQQEIQQLKREMKDGINIKIPIHTLEGCPHFKQAKRIDFYATPKNKR